MAEQHVEALSALFTERYGQMVGFARRRLRDQGVPPSAADPEDIVQHSFELVLARTEPIAKLRPYVFTVIRREVGHAARRYRTGQGYGSLDADVQLEDVQPEGASTDPCGAAETHLDVEAALRSLPPQQRRAVFYNKALGLTQAETAAAMQTAPGTVATHVHRAVATLRVTLSTLVLVLIACGTVWLFGGVTGVIPAAGYRRLVKGPDAVVVAVSVWSVAVTAVGLYSYASARPGREIRTPVQRLGVWLRNLMRQRFGRRDYFGDLAEGMTESESFVSESPASYGSPDRRRDDGFDWV
ncbi:RNA polymerase sigma factor [Streptomyces chartreusis]